MDPEALTKMVENLQYLRDRQDILDCIVRECRGRDRHDAELTASAYWDDGMIEAGSRITKATDYPTSANAGHAAGFAATAHNITNHTCRIDGDVAYSEAYCVGGLLSKDLKTCKWVGSRYIDRLERRNGEWRIKLRRNSIEMVAEGSADWLQSLTGFLRGSWTKDDPSYFEQSGTERRW